MGVEGILRDGSLGNLNVVVSEFRSLIDNKIRRPKSYPQKLLLCELILAPDQTTRPRTLPSVDLFGKLPKVYSLPTRPRRLSPLRVLTVTGCVA